MHAFPPPPPPNPPLVDIVQNYTGHGKKIKVQNSFVDVTYIHFTYSIITPPPKQAPKKCPVVEYGPMVYILNFSL